MLLDGKQLGLFRRVSAYTDAEGRPSVTLFLPKIPVGSPPELVSMLVEYRDEVRRLLAPMSPWVELVDSATIPAMAAIREE